MGEEITNETAPNKMKKGDIFLKLERPKSPDKFIAYIRCGNGMCQNEFTKTELGDKYTGNCPDCNTTLGHVKIKVTSHKERVEKIECRNFTVSDEYRNNSTVDAEEYINFTCNICKTNGCKTYKSFMKVDGRNCNNCKYCKSNGIPHPNLIDTRETTVAIVETNHENVSNNNDDIINPITEKLISNGLTLVKSLKTSIYARCDAKNHIVEIKNEQLSSTSILNCSGCRLLKNKRSVKQTSDVEKINEQCAVKNATLVSTYINNQCIIELQCNECETVYYKRANNFLRVGGKDNGCSVCFEKVSAKKKKYEENALIGYKQFKKYAEEEGYELLSEQSEYKKKRSRCLIKCPNGHEYRTTFENFSDPRGPRRCDKCTKQNLSKQNRLSLKDAKMYASEANLNLLTENYKNMKSKCTFKCKDCTFEFISTLDNVRNCAASCPFCNGSAGEKRVSAVLKAYIGNKFEREKIFEDCRHNRFLRFDFYIETTRKPFIIEFDGEQHFESVEHFGGYDNFVDTRLRDLKKILYCEQKSIPLFRIAYKDINRLGDVVKRIFAIMDGADIPKMWFSNEKFYEEFNDEYECYKIDSNIV